MRDNIDFYMEHELEEERQYQRWLETRPVCDECGEYITDDWCWEIGNEVFCEDCLNKLFRKSLD